MRRNQAVKDPAYKNKSRKIKFIGKGKDLMGIMLLDILLCIVTLGIYYPWAKVRNKKFM